MTKGVCFWLGIFAGLATSIVAIENCKDEEVESNGDKGATRGRTVGLLDNERETDKRGIRDNLE